MQFDFLLMRHAYSRHNLEKDQWKDRFGDKSYKKLPEYRISKFAPELIDSSWIDSSQCQEVRTAHIDSSKVALVLCSPLKRCLQTCRQLFEGQETPPVIVEPMLSSRLSAAWTIGSETSLLQKEYPSFDFSALEAGSDPWMVQLLSHLERVNSKDMAGKGLTMQQYLLTLVEQGQGETYAEFFQRTRHLKNKIRQLVETNVGKDYTRKEVLIIAHSCVLSFLLGTELNQKGKVRDKISFDHCLPQRFSSSQVLGSSVVSPQAKM